MRRTHGGIGLSVFLWWIRVAICGVILIQFDLCVISMFGVGWRWSRILFAYICGVGGTQKTSGGQGLLLVGICNVIMCLPASAFDWEDGRLRRLAQHNESR